MLDARARRIADNESRFRDINERLEADLRRIPVDDDDPVDFVCECGFLECTASVRLTIDEYERVRSDPHLFAVLPGHQIEGAENVVAKFERFYVVRKKPVGQAVVEDTDPRAGDR